ncbi:MAG: galactokinase, partial [Candidatus Dormibacteraeota bacterium]|nr:galactokinase [Candidatus Dormibacteraeota bacterium]
MDPGREAVAARAAELHRGAFGSDPAAIAVSPGRINIIGEHTDYAGGLCLPAAIDRYLAVAVSQGERIEVASERHEDVVRAEPEALVATGGWADHALGVVAELGTEGLAVPARLAIASDIPQGSGLSSSAALGVAATMAVLDLADLVAEPLDVGRLARAAENNFVGVPTGLMDQAAAVLGRRDHALLFDAGAEIGELVPLPGEIAWLVIQSGIERELRRSGYAERAGEAAEALRLARQTHPELGGLCELEPHQVEALALPEPLGRRARHIAGECVRVRMAVACLEAGNIEALGQLVLTSHRSLARDYEVSLPELDQIVEVAVEAGCRGARLMGAGFGGSVLAVVAAS